MLPGGCRVCGDNGTGRTGSDKIARQHREKRRKRHLAWRREIEDIFRDFGYSTRTPNQAAEHIEYYIFGEINRGPQ